MRRLLRPLRRLLRLLAKGTVRALPGARGQALVDGGHALVSLVTGRPSGKARRRAAKAARAAQRTSSRARESSDPDASTTRRAAAKGSTRPDGERLTDAAREEIEAAEQALQDGRAREAAARSGALAAQLPTNRRVHELHAAALEGGDDARALALALHRLHVLHEDADVRRRERVAAGRVVVLSPGWLPRLPQGPAAAAQPDPHAVLVLASESVPYRTTALTERLEARLVDLAATGLRPEVVTALGFPRSAGAKEIPRVDAPGGVPHHRLDLGASYPLDDAADRRVRDAAWLTARIAAELRPAVLHAVVGAGDLEIALVAAALRDHLGVPLVADVVGDVDLPTADGAAGEARAAASDAERAAAALAAALDNADAVITGDDVAVDALRAVVAAAGPRDTVGTPA